MDEIYFTEKVAARIFFLHSRWKSSRENERFCTKVSNVKFLFSRRNRQFFFFFPSYDRMSIDRVICSSFFCGTRFSIAILDPVLSQPMVIGMNGQIFSFPSFFFFPCLIKFPSNRGNRNKIFMIIGKMGKYKPKIYSCKLEALFLIFQNIFFTN